MEGGKQEATLRLYCWWKQSRCAGYFQGKLLVLGLNFITYTDVYVGVSLMLSKILGKYKSKKYISDNWKT